MKLNQQQHEFIESLGFTLRIKAPTSTTYWHSGTGIRLICVSSPSLKDVGERDVMDTVIAVPNDISEALASILPDFAADVVKLKDLPHFMMFRAFSDVCSEHRQITDNFRKYGREYDEAQRAVEQANEAFELTGTALQEHSTAFSARAKPPVFRPAAFN